MARMATPDDARANAAIMIFPPMHASPATGNIASLAASDAAGIVYAGDVDRQPQ